MTLFGAFSPDGKTLATIGSRTRVDLHDTRSGSFLRTLELEPEILNFGSNSSLPLLNIAFLPDGVHMLAASHPNGIIRKVDVHSGQEVGKMVVSTFGIADMTVSTDGAVVAALESERNPGRTNYQPDLPGNRVILLDAITGKHTGEIQTQGNVSAMALSADGTHLLLSAEKGGTGVWDTKRCKQTGILPHKHPGGNDLRALAYSPNGAIIARGVRSGVQVYDAGTFREVAQQPGQFDPMKGVAMHPTEPIVATGSSDGSLVLWDRTTGKMLSTLTTGLGEVASVKYSPDGAFLYAIVGMSIEPPHSSIVCWSTATKKELWRIDDHPTVPGTLAISPDGQLVAALGNSNGFLIAANTGVQIRAIQAGADEDFFNNGWGRTAEISFAPGGHEVIAWGHKKGIHRWDVRTGAHTVQQCDNFMRLVYATAISPDGAHFLVGGSDKHLFLADTHLGKKVREFQGISDEIFGSVLGVAFSPEAPIFAWGGPADGIVRLVDARTGKVHQKLYGSGGRSIPAAFSKDGKTLITSSLDGTALIWDLTKVPVELSAEQ
jgi:WD40 repeat protein